MQAAVGISRAIESQGERRTSTKDLQDIMTVRSRT